MSDGYLTSTVVGSMKKPDYLTIPCWVNTDGSENLDHVAQLSEVEKKTSKDTLEENILRATRDALNTQCTLGINIVTDGEMRRNNYIYPFCRNLTGFDFINQKEKICRNGNWTAMLPCVVSEISLKPEAEISEAKDEWQISQDYCHLPVKYTLPGPLTIADSVVNSFYETDDILTEKLAEMVNMVVLSLAKQGCKHIQVDEPVMVRYPHMVANTIKNLERCFQGVPKDVTKITHMCCGYPQYLDQRDYEKAAPSAYLDVAQALNDSTIDQVSIEDAHRRNPKELFAKLKDMTVILGVVDVSISRVESVEEIRDHINDVLQHFPREQLIIAPDCGLIFLPDDIMKAKLTNMQAAIKLCC